MEYEITPIVDEVRDENDDIVVAGTPLNKALLETKMQVAIRDIALLATQANDAIELLADSVFDAVIARLSGVIVARHYVNGAWEARGDLPAGVVVWWIATTAGAPTPLEMQTNDRLSRYGV